MTAAIPGGGTENDGGGTAGICVGGGTLKLTGRAGGKNLCSPLPPAAAKAAGEGVGGGRRRFIGGGNGGGGNVGVIGGGASVCGSGDNGTVAALLVSLPLPVIGRPLVCCIPAAVRSNFGGIVGRIDGDMPPVFTTETPIVDVVHVDATTFFSSSSISFNRFIRVTLWSLFAAGLCTLDATQVGII